MNNKNIFVFSGIFYLIGIFITNLDFGLTTSLLVLLFLVVLFLLLFIKTKIYIILSIFSIISFLLGIFISNLNLIQIKKNNDFINSFTDKTTIETQIKKIDKITDKYTVYIGKLIKINNENIDENIFLEIYLNGNYKLENKTKISFESKIYRFEEFNGFDYEKYMLSKELYFKTYPYNYEKISEEKENIIIKEINDTRKKMLEIISTIYTRDEATFLGGILLGARESLPKELSTNFNNSGLTHIIAVSGFNITIIIIFFGYIVKSLPSILKTIIMSLLIVIFTILVGLGAAVIRAAIMGIIGYIVVNSGRKGDTLAIIILTLVIMVSFSPLSLNYDISLQLSFLAVLGIIYTEKYIEKIFHFLPNFFEIKTAFCLTISAMIFTLPIMLFNFGQVSIISPISNLLVIWTIPIIMSIGFMSILSYILNPFLGIIIGYFSLILLKWDLLIVNFFGSSKYSIIKYDFGLYKNYYEIIYFLVLIFIIIWFKKEKPQP
ncbi:MAG: ComEC/Rec2 family competence protein [Candidatus Gracilibacteria bacterium]|nr:ComEC/Rec2 family competence protein [Candidatus Gracilibacteria bacterium]